MRKTSVFCDRSGKPIDGERGVLPPGVSGHVVVAVSGPCDLFIHCPWLPAVHGLRFDDLGDEDRRVLVPLLLRIARKTKHQDEYLAGATGYTGGPLGTGDEVADGGAPTMPSLFVERTDSHVSVTELHKCASPTCPGFPWKASDQRHPCGEIRVASAGAYEIKEGEQTIRDRRNARALELATAAPAAEAGTLAETLRAEDPSLGIGASVDVAAWALRRVVSSLVGVDPAPDET